MIEDRKARAEARGAALVAATSAWLSLVALVLSIIAALSCTPLQTPEGPILIAPAAAAERFASDVERATGMRPGAFTLPLECVPPIYLDRATAEDACARLHEATHVRQREAERREAIALSYWGQFERCWRAERWRPESFDGCYRGVSYEREAYEVQRACEAARAAGGAR